VLQAAVVAQGSRKRRDKIRAVAHQGDLWNQAGGTIRPIDTAVLYEAAKAQRIDGYAQQAARECERFDRYRHDASPRARANAYPYISATRAKEAGSCDRGDASAVYLDLEASS
jgi:hypothetical protein